MSIAASTELSLRPEREEDTPFLLALYASTRETELGMMPWTADQKTAFVQQQFGAQRTAWRSQYPEATFDVIECDGVPIGRLYVDRWTEEIRVVDISLVAAHRGHGVGSALLRTVIAEAESSCRCTSLHVEAFNPARRLYARLGFAEFEDKGVHVLMVRPLMPPATED